MKKYYFLIIGLALVLNPIFAQPFINSRQHFGYLATTFTGIVPTDSCLYMKGTFTDTSFTAGTYFAKFDLLGNLLWKKEIMYPSFEYASWFSDLVHTPSGNFVFSGYELDFSSEPSKMSCFVVEYDPQGSVINTNTFLSPYDSLDKNFIYPTSVTNINSGGYVIGGNINYYEPDGAFIAKLDDTLGLTWIKTLGGPYGDACMSVAEAADGTIYAGGIETTGIIGQNLINRHVITAIDSTGQEEIWRWAYPEVSIPQGGSWIRDLLVLPDGSIIAATSVTKEEYVNAENNFVVNYPAMIKLNPDRTVAWVNLMGNHVFENDDIDLRKIVFANDGGGYITVTSKNTTAYQDTTKINGRLGLIEKVSETGDSVWLRHIYHLAGEGESPTHQIFDMASAANHTGYWICGQANKQLPDQAYQQGWLLFVDNNGCMVPNCQEVNSSETIPISEKILIYPNPVSTSAAIYHGGYPFSKGRFRLLDVQGSVVQEWTAPIDDLTTMIDLERYTTGTYFLQYLEAGAVKVTKKLIVTGR